jgi:predicted amidohydrolase
MQNLSVTLVQTTQQWENKAGNLTHFDGLFAQIPATDLVLLPEMFHTGFSMNAEALAESINAAGIAWLKKMAREKDTAIYTSLIIKEDDHFYNRGVFVQPDGNIDLYDKQKRFAMAGEDLVYSAGEKPTIVHWKGWNINLQICYDLRFPEIVRNSLNEDGKAAYDVILYVANWPERRALHWKSLLIARAIENQCYVAGLNRVGTDGNGLTYSGDSMVVDALGTVHGCEASVEEIKTVELNYTDLMTVRQQLPFLKDGL